jgi:dTDP-4-dehydrorhamnose 3,5-epimerase
LFIVEKQLPEVKEIQPEILRDSRGSFLETYHESRYAELGITETFVQDNQSFSVKGTLRGLHYQLRHAQAKICRVIEGEALDIAVDIRVGSPRFGKWASTILSGKKQNQIYIPAGFAHGFLALTEGVQLAYKCSEYYDPEDTYGILWSDPGLAIPWGISAPILSGNDMKYPPLSTISHELLPRYSTK